MRLRYFLILSVFFIGFISSAQAVIDSVGVEVVDGKKYILHKVEPKETLYSLSKKYALSTDEITAANPGSDMGISVGQILKIPTNQSVENETTEEVTPQQSATHTVKPGETLYAISTLYPCSVDDIKKWNNLTSNALDVGQKLAVSEPSTGSADSGVAEATETEATETVEETIEETQETVEETIEDTSTEEVEESTTTSETEETTEDVSSNDEVAQKYVKEDDRPIDIDIQIKTKEQIDRENTERLLQSGSQNDSLPSKKTVDMGGYSKVFEKGYAVLMSDTKNDEHYLAQHRTLPEGTILQIRNLDNGKNVFVRVVGLLEHEDPKVIIAVSTKAETRLQSGNTTFLSEISYIP